MTKKLNPKTRAALKSLARAMTIVPASRFDMMNWSRGGVRPALECGFAGCGIGWGIYLGVFTEAGIPLVFEDSTAQPQYRGKDAIIDGRNGIAQALKISKSDVDHLFMPSSYPKFEDEDERGTFKVPPAAVASRLREYLREHA